MAAQPKAMAAQHALAQMAARMKMTKMPEPPKLSKKGPMVMEPGAYPPELYLSSQQAPFISEWKAGDTVSLLVKARVRSVSVSETKSDNGKRRTNVTLEITHAAGVPAP